ncbi:right-handed parallel beta-helix repeat-containing protein [uncultured Tenacibaculum sp.]|uniref:right-handed parallel beta-helix repeat-containing protein n=1 Tax=uncultured Tenacibaculum sp. TaxID=174713 RepID=UPI0026213185|nr:right-handed parallel beta-helix repeat-containing protein [uncultured Tenacibaculum sp.]
MKKIIAILYVSTIFSCSKDNGIVLNDNKDDQPQITTPCKPDFLNIQSNSTIEVNCLLDLQGETIILPSNVSFEYKGGSIINGALKFSGGNISGELLNHKLTVEGNVKLKSNTFFFEKEKWDLTEGQTTSEIALQNTAKLENLFFLIKNLGADTFKIDELDAFFEVTKVTSTTTNQNWYPSLEAVNLPSDFNLIMSDNTHLRIFPADRYNRKSGAILAVRDAENITISGGNFYGDRDERVFSPDDTGIEGSHLIHIHSGRNIVVDGGNFQDGSSGTFAIYSFGFAFNPDYNPTTNVTIKNCTIKNSRRMAIALVDGRNVTIENNTFINTGQPSANTDGGEVGYAINIEPERFRDSNGELKERQRVFDVLIKNNTESGSRGGFLTLTIGQDITVEENNIGTRVVSSFTSGIRIRKNKFKALGEATDSWAMFIAGSGETVFDNEIFGNTIEGYSSGIIVGTKDASIHNNTILNCGAGIQISKAENITINNNNIDVSKNGIQATNTYANNITFKENKVKTSGNYSVYFAQMNNKSEDQSKTVLFEKNTFYNDKSLIFSNAYGVTFTNNIVNGGITLNNATNCEVLENEIIPIEKHGISLSNSLNNIKIANNQITKPTGTTSNYECIKNNSTTITNVTQNNNSCN